MKLIKNIIVMVGFLFILSCGTKSGPTPPKGLNLRQLLIDGWTAYGKHNIDIAYAKFDTIVSQIRADTGDGYIGLGNALKDLGYYNNAISSFSLASALLNTPLKLIKELVFIKDSSYIIKTSNPVGVIIPDSFVICEVGVEDSRGFPVGSKIKYKLKTILNDTLIILTPDFSPGGPPRAGDRIYLSYYTYDDAKEIKEIHLLVYPGLISSLFASQQYWEAAGRYREFEILLNELGKTTFRFTDAYPNLISDQGINEELNSIFNERNVKLIGAWSYFMMKWYDNSTFIVRELINDPSWTPANEFELLQKLTELSN